MRIELKRTIGHDLRSNNRSVLLSQLFLRGPLSRFELSELTGLSPGAASKITAELIEEKIVVEAGQVESDGGRPRILLRVNPKYGHVIGVFVAETDVRVEIFDLAMTRLAEIVSALPAVSSADSLNPDIVADLIVAGIRSVIATAGVASASVLGVGVGVPGNVEQGFAALVHAPNTGWDAVPLHRMLRERGLTMPVHLESRVKILGQAEMWFGAGRGARHAMMVVVGSEVGAAMVTDGVTYRSVGSSANGWGHTKIMYGGRKCQCGQNGCLEAYIGAKDVLERYRNTQLDGEISGRDDPSQFRSMLDASTQSSVVAALLEEVLDLLGAGIANLINVFDPERVILGGWLGLALGQEHLPRIRQTSRENSLPHLAARSGIELSTLGEGAFMLGAATLPVTTLLFGDAVRG